MTMTPQERAAEKASKNRKAESAARANDRAKQMLALGFVSVARAAELTMQPRQNIYHWMNEGVLGKKNWGAGRGSVFVSVADLKKKFPLAFAKPAKAARGAP